MKNEYFMAIIVLVICLQAVMPLCIFAEEGKLTRSASSVVKEEKIENAAVYYNKAFELNTWIWKDNDPLSEKIMQVIKNGWEDKNKELEELLKQNELTFAEFEKGIGLEKCDFTFGKTYDNPYAQPIVNLLKARNLSNLIILRGRLYERQNNYEQAIKEYLSVFTFAWHISQDEQLVSIMITSAIENMAIMSLQQYLEKKEVSQQLCKKILAFLQDVSSKRNSLVAAIEREKQNYLWVKNIVIKEVGAKVARDENFIKKLSESFRSCSDKYYGLLIKIAQTNSEVFKKEFQNEFAALAKTVENPANAANTKNPLEAVASLVIPDSAKRNKEITDAIAENEALLFAYIAVPNIVGAVDPYYFTETKFMILEAAAAMRVYIAEKNKIPEALNDLVPDYLLDVPIDPWSGQALKYINKDKELIIYSVGPDRIDNGGLGMGYDANIKELEGKDIIFSMKLRK